MNEFPCLCIVCLPFTQYSDIERRLFWFPAKNPLIGFQIYHMKKKSNLRLMSNAEIFK